METKRLNKYKIIYIAAFIALHILNSFLMTTSLVFPDINPYPRTFFMMINSFFGDFGFIMLFLGLAVLIFKTDYKRGKFIMIVSIVLSILYLGMSVYIYYYKTFFSFYNLETFGTPAGGKAFMFLIRALPGLIIKAKFIFLLPAAIVITLYIFFFYRNRKKEEFFQSSFITGLNRLYIGILMFAIGFLTMGNSLSAYFFDINDTWYEDNATPIYGIQTTGLFNYYIYDAYSYFFTDEVYPEEKKKEIEVELEKYKNIERTSPIDGITYGNSAFAGIFKDKNLVMVQVESLNNFVVGLTIEIDGQPVEVTPNLNRILSNSVYLNNYYHSVGIGNTSDAEFTNLTGLNPIGPNFTILRYNNVQYQTLPKLFRDKGYSSISVHANTGAFYERANIHPNLYGFDVHYSEEKLEMNSDNLIHTWLNDTDMLRQTVDLMKKHSQNGPVFVFPITISNHTPYNKPLESKNGWFKEKENLFPDDFKLVNSIIRNPQHIGYLEHVSYTDYALGVLFDCLEEKGLADDTIVILYGDHGCGFDVYDMFYENPDIFANPINYINNHAEDPISKRLMERKLLQNIPFIIFDPSGKTIKENGILETQIISLVRGTNCTARTVANLFDLNPKYYFGVDALSDAVTFVYNPRNHDIYVDGMVISGQSEDYYIYDDNYLFYYTEDKIKDIINAFHEYKDFNDKLLKYQIFPPLI
ncbi:MAG: LTA synthase family protein [Bacilli bacterium]|nr:LTA synthase family protein [Bacilli bacterium]MDD4076398.1 LTA synthase family protein [Bacilli bacterium]MDD4388104.1 LTA synthase family protein [Bacilli bacterium]